MLLQWEFLIWYHKNRANLSFLFACIQSKSTIKISLNVCIQVYSTGPSAGNVIFNRIQSPYQFHKTPSKFHNLQLCFITSLFPPCVLSSAPVLPCTKWFALYIVLLWLTFHLISPYFSLAAVIYSIKLIKMLFHTISISWKWFWATFCTWIDKPFRFATIGLLDRFREFFHWIKLFKFINT